MLNSFFVQIKLMSKMLSGTDFLKKPMEGDSKKLENSDKSETEEQPIGQKVRLLNIVDSFLDKPQETVFIASSGRSKCLSCGQVIRDSIFNNTNCNL
jgi:hypothetical protein